MKDSGLIVLSALALLALIVAVILANRKSIINKKINTDREWDSVKREINKKYLLLKQLRQYVEISSHIKKEDKVSLDETILRAQNAYAKSYKGYDPFECYKAEIIVRDLLKKELDRVSKISDKSVEKSFSDFNAKEELIDKSFRKTKRSYNELALGYNSKIKSFPSNLMVKDGPKKIIGKKEQED